jgi:hypothetical protein
MARKTQTIEQLDASIKRWKTRLRRAVNTLGTLEKKRNRLATKAAVAAVLDPMIAAMKPGPVTIEVTRHPVLTTASSNMPASPEPGNAGTVQITPVNTDIPEFLRRGQAAQKAVDEVIADQIREEQAATKKAKAQGRIAKMKAKKAGDLKKMPLSGRAALDAIRNG